MTWYQNISGGVRKMPNGDLVVPEDICEWLGREELVETAYFKKLSEKDQLIFKSEETEEKVETKKQKRR